MFAGPTFVLIHTLISIVAIIAGIGVMGMLLRDRRPDIVTAIFLVFAIATLVTGFMFPFTGVTPAFATGVLASAFLAPALLAQFVFRFAGPWRWIYALGMSVNVYLLIFVLITQSFLKIPFLHALAPLAPAVPQPAFAGSQAVLLAVFVWLTWRAVRKFHGGGAGMPAAAVQPGV